MSRTRSGGPVMNASSTRETRNVATVISVSVTTFPFRAYHSPLRGSLFELGSKLEKKEKKGRRRRRKFFTKLLNDQKLAKRREERKGEEGEGEREGVVRRCRPSPLHPPRSKNLVTAPAIFSRSYVICHGSIRYGQNGEKQAIRGYC